MEFPLVLQIRQQQQQHRQQQQQQQVLPQQQQQQQERQTSLKGFILVVRGPRPRGFAAGLLEEENTAEASPHQSKP